MNHPILLGPSRSWGPDRWGLSPSLLLPAPQSLHSTCPGLLGTEHLWQTDLPHMWQLMEVGRPQCTQTVSILVGDSS